MKLDKFVFGNKLLMHFLPYLKEENEDENEYKHRILDKLDRISDDINGAIKNVLSKYYINGETKIEDAFIFAIVITSVLSSVVLPIRDRKDYSNKKIQKATLCTLNDLFNQGNEFIKRGGLKDEK